MTGYLTWFDDLGPYALDDETGVIVTEGAMGLNVPPVTNNVDERTGADGGLLVNRRTPTRVIDLPVEFFDDARARTKIAALASRLNRGPGTLRFDDGAAPARLLRSVVYDGGLEGSELSNNTFRRGALSLRALDPWWYGAAESRTMSLVAATAFDDAAIAFDSAVTPFDGGGTTTFTVGGDADAYPVWTLTGPFTSLTIVVAGSESFALSSALAAGSYITVDTRPGGRGPSLNGGGVNWALLTAASRLPMFNARSTSVAVSVAGTTGASVVSVAYEPRWLTP